MQEEAVESFFLHFYEYSLTDSGICPGTSYLPFTEEQAGLVICW